MEKKQNIFFRLFKLLIWILVLFGIVFYNKYSNFKENTLNSKKINIIINKGESFRNLSTKFVLENGEKLINKDYLKVYLKFNKPNFNLQAGVYKIKKDTTIKTLFEQLKKPIVAEEISITILEGWNIYDIDDYLSNKKLIDKGDFIKYSEINGEGIKKFRLEYKFLEKAISLEGFLYPDSYRLFKNKISSEYLSKKMLNNFNNKIYKKYLLDKSPKEIEKIINLASIVEKEEKSDIEKSTVAGVLKSRLDKGWQIGADITVCYPHKLTANECKMVISQYIREKSDYNTRTMVGLPKTPIGNPQLSSIKATINPNITGAMYYLHNTNTGKIYYAKTNSEHEANKKYLYK